MRSEKQTGELAAYGAAILWSLFPVITVITVSRLSPLYTATIGTGISALFFACVLTWRKGWSQIRSRHAWKNMLLATVFIGIIFYVFIFIGYRFTSPGNGALVGLMEIFFTFVIVNIFWKHEKFVPIHALGGILMGIGAILILIPKHTEGWNIGDLLIFIATMVPPIGNIYAQRARKQVSADMLMFVRSAISTVFLFLLALVFEPVPTYLAISHSFWYLLFSGIFLLGLSKILWLEAIHRLPIAKTVSLTEIAVLLTLLFSYLLLGQGITQEQAMSIVPMLVGVFLLTRK